MKNIFLLLLFPSILFPQINFSEHISPIIYSECTVCHRDGGAGPMPFTSYEEVASLGSMIEDVTATEYMPPWFADIDYSHFLGERFLSDEEKQLIADWVNGGMVQGDPSLEAEIPEFPEGSVIGEPDVELEMSEAYLVEGNNQDDYRVFVFPTNFSEEKEVRCIEFIPGNPVAVHHALINIDIDGQCAALDAETPEYGYECVSGFCTGDIPFLSAGYVPGAVPPIWNNDVGIKIPAGSDIAIQIHYAPSSIDQYDQSKVNIFFKEEPIEREVQIFTLIDASIQIPANEIYTHYNSFEISEDISLLSVLPHCHLTGQSWLIYAEQNEDTIPIISIPDWDFNWQNFYQPEYMLKIPQGYTIHVYCTYDNTADNPVNPNSPPENLYWCDYTTCEMFFIPFAYVLYETGDENTYLGDPVYGCLDENAYNYDSDSNTDDGTCCYVAGCTDSTSINYNQNACFDDGSCILLVSGCMDSGACNFNPLANMDDGSCEYAVENYDCEGNCLNDIDLDGVCDEIDECIGEYDECGECNGNGSQEYYDCDGNCINDIDLDGVCDEIECFTVFCQEWYECILGDCVCIADVDLDEICNEYDNCPEDYNPNQEDFDNDGIGDDCDPMPLSIDEISNNKTLIKIIDVLGREIPVSKNDGVLLYIFDDRSVERKLIFNK